MKKINQAQKLFLEWTLQTYTFSSTTTYKLRKIIQNGGYRQTESDFLNSIRDDYVRTWYIVNRTPLGAKTILDYA